MEYDVYVKLNENNYITAINSSAFLNDSTGWIIIDSGEGDRYRHAKGNYFEKPLRTEKGAYRYKVVDEKPIACSDNEIAEQEAQIEAASPPVIDIIQVDAQVRKAVQLFAMTLPEETALEIPYVYDSWRAGRTYIINEYLTYGVNEVGDPQLYKVVQTHTSQADWVPGKQPALYTAIGLDDSGHPLWSQPTGAHDAYNIGDIVNYNGELYKSLINGNTYSPDFYPGGWELYTE